MEGGDGPGWKRLVRRPIGFDEKGGLVTAQASQLANPAFRFGAQRGGELRAVGDLKRSRTNRAAAIRTPVNLPTWGHFAAVIRTFQGKGAKENLATAKAGNKDAY